MILVNNLKVYFLVIFIAVGCMLFPQSDKKYSHYSLAEKIYLQLDNEVYTTNKTIWFKAIIANAVLHEKEFTSGVLYVELINSQEKILQSKILKITEGIGSGFFDLDRSYEPGDYLVRAYTEWNKNFNQDFLFKKYIKIFSEDPNNNPSIAYDFKIVDATDGAKFRKLKLSLNHQVIGEKNINNLKVVLRYNNMEELVELSNISKNEYLLNQQIPDSVGLLELSIQTQDGKNFETLINTDPEFFDVQFFPEGGNLVDRLSCRIGFKSTDKNGLGKYVKGEILDEAGKLIQRFTSNKLGMGSFTIEKVDINSPLRAILKDSSGNYIKTLNLPSIQKFGYTVRVNEQNDTISVVASHNQSTTKNIFLSATSRGYEYYKKKVQLGDGEHIFKIPKNIFPEGVIKFTIFDELDLPVMERVFFNKRKSARIDFSVVLNKEDYKQREKVNITLNSNVKNSGISTSVLVLNKDVLGEIQSARENILSYFLLSSDLKGHIEAPGSYFVENSDLNIDDLMLTQGWSRYKYRNLPVSKLNFVMENGLNIKGVVNKVNSKFKRDSIDLVLMIFDKNKPLTFIESVALPGNFNFNLPDLFGNDKDIIIEGLIDSKKDKIKTNVALSNKTSIPIIYQTKGSGLIIEDSLVKSAIVKNQQQKAEQDKYYEDVYGVTKLDEVVLDDYKLTPLRKKVNDKYGKPNFVIKGEKIKEQEPDWSNGLYNSLRYGDFQDKLYIRRTANGNYVAQVAGQQTLVLVDGIPVKEFNLLDVQYIKTEEVVSFEIINNAKNFKSLVAEVYSTFPPYGIVDGSIISIYTKSGQGLFGAINPTKNLDVKSISVFSLQKEFYTPKHNELSAIDWANPDLRNPILWLPEVQFDSNGMGKISYYNSDSTGNHLIVLESISNEGYVGYQEITYSVRESNTDD